MHRPHSGTLRGARRRGGMSGGGVVTSSSATRWGGREEGAHSRGGSRHSVGVS